MLVYQRVFFSEKIHRIPLATTKRYHRQLFLGPAMISLLEMDSHEFHVKALGQERKKHRKMQESAGAPFDQQNQWTMKFNEHLYRYLAFSKPCILQTLHSVAALSGWWCNNHLMKNMSSSTGRIILYIYIWFKMVVDLPSEKWWSSSVGMMKIPIC